MTASRVIKKYPNRRLYDTELSRYVTVSDVRNLVMKSVDFKVTDSTTDEDLTRSILLQIMLEEESGGKPLFTSKMLAQMIRFYGGSVQGLFARYLEESLSLFANNQEKMRSVLPANPLDVMTKMAQRNMEIWVEMQNNLFKTSGLAEQNDKEEKE